MICWAGIKLTLCYFPGFRIIGATLGRHNLIICHECSTRPIPDVLPGSIPAAQPPQLRTHNDSNRDAYCRCQDAENEYQYKQHHSEQGCRKTSGPA